MYKHIGEVVRQLTPAQGPIHRIGKFQQWAYAARCVVPPGRPAMHVCVIDDDIEIVKLKHAGKTVPHDVSVIGYDDVPFARYASPALSTISQNTAKAGRMLVSKLLDAHGQKAGRSERIPTDLIIRESCGG